MGVGIIVTVIWHFLHHLLSFLITPELYCFLLLFSNSPIQYELLFFRLDFLWRAELLLVYRNFPFPNSLPKIFLQNSEIGAKNGSAIFLYLFQIVQPATKFWRLSMPSQVRRECNSTGKIALVSLYKDRPV